MITGTQEAFEAIRKVEKQMNGKYKYMQYVIVFRLSFWKFKLELWEGFK